MNKYSLMLLIVAVVVAIATLLPRMTYVSPGNTGRLRVITSFYPLYYLAHEIGGDQVDVYNITPAGAEPHDYEPTARDIARIYDSNILVLLGNSLESWGPRIQKDIPSTVLVAALGSDYSNRELVEDGHTLRDPHIWLDPKIMHAMATRILNIYVLKDPAHQSYYVSRANALYATLDALDQAYREQLASCRNRSFITSHAAFGYMAREYGLEQIAVAGVSPDAEPSVRRLAEVATIARQHNIRYIFFENLISPKLSATIAHEVGAQTLVLDPIEGVSDQDMQSRHNYATIMYSNLKNLKIALSCQ